MCQVYAPIGIESQSCAEPHHDNDEAFSCKPQELGTTQHHEDKVWKVAAPDLQSIDKRFDHL
jgi:hypothetical protein